MKALLQIVILGAMILCFSNSGFSQASGAIEKTQNIIDRIIARSYPELKAEKINVKIFNSDSNYFKSQFSIFRPLTFQKINYQLFVNPKVFDKNAPELAIEAIIAHELAHISYYRRKNFFQLLGLVALTDKSFTAKFERKADLETISRGYGEGLKIYRLWLYQNIPNESLKGKKRDYFSPEELDRIMEIIKQKPEMIDIWRKKIPQNLAEISVQ